MQRCNAFSKFKHISVRRVISLTCFLELSILYKIEHCVKILKRS
nr:MAG TPA: hypothetical protein [Caudoviricetes sp.]